MSETNSGMTNPVETLVMFSWITTGRRVRRQHYICSKCNMVTGSRCDPIHRKPILKDYWYGRMIRETLSDIYIKTLLVAGTSLTRDQIPDELVAAQREFIRNKRLINQEFISCRT